MTSISAKLIVFVVFPDVKLLDLTGPMQVFTDTRLFAERGYDVKVVSMSAGMITSDTPVPVATLALSDLPDTRIDTLIVAGGSGAFAACEDAPFIEQIRTLAAKSDRVASVCTGAFILAHAGLLSGKSAVTHWDSCALLSETFKDIDVQSDAIFTQDGPIWTSAGVTAGIDMSLAMVAQDMGRRTALALARSLVCYMVRPGGQSQFSAPLQQQVQTSTGKFDELNAWIMDNLATDLSVDRLAAQAGMSPRNFARLYKSTTGTPPAKAVEGYRTEAACRLLEDTDLPLATISDRCGFFDDERLRRALMRSRNVAPGTYRQRFKAAHA